MSINSRRTQNDYTYSSLSELIRKSLVAYQEKEVEINPTEREKFASKREITIRFFNSDICWTFIILYQKVKEQLSLKKVYRVIWKKWVLKKFWISLLSEMWNEIKN